MEINLLLAALLASPVAAQQGSIRLDNFLGLNDTDSPATLSRGEAQAALNIESNLEGTALFKRKGFTREASLTITTSTVNGAITGSCDNGDLLTIVCNDRQCSKSINGAGFTVFLSTAGGTGALPVRWSLVTFDGDFFGANDRRDAVFKYDCTTLTYPSNIPAGSLLALTEDRMVVADTSANPNRVNYSKSGDFVTFTTGANAVDPWNDDIGTPGDKINALKYDRGRLYIFKRTSLTACQLGDQYTTRCFPVSSNIGTQDPESIVSAPDGLYFRGQERNYWKLSEQGLELLSKKISRYVKNQAAGSNKNNTQTTQSDWEAGSQNPANSWNTATRAGSILNSSMTLIDNTTSLLALGTCTDCGVNPNGYISFIGVTSTYTFKYEADAIPTSDGWSKSTYGTAPTEGASGGIFTASLVSINDGVRYARAVSNSAISRQFVFRTKRDSSSDSYSILGAANGTGIEPAVSIGAYVDIRAASTRFYADSTLIYTDTSIAETAYSIFTLIVTTDSSVYWWRDGNFIASKAVTNAYANSTYAWWGVSTQSGDSSAQIYMDFFYVSSGVPVGVSNIATVSTFTSRIMDTTYSTPTVAAFIASTMTTLDTTFAWSVRFSTSPNNDLWTAYEALNSGNRPTTAPLRYFQYKSSFTKSNSLILSPGIVSASMIAATTGTFRTQCIQPSSNISAWGILSCTEAKLGAGSLVYYATSATTCATLPTSTPPNWQTSPTNNATLAVSTNVALYIGWSSLLGSATDQAQVDACTVYWNEGVVAQPVWGIYDSFKNSIYWTGTTTASTTSDRLLKYDMNLHYFYPFDLSATALNIVNGSVYFGSSGGGYWNKFGASGVDSDNGADINAYWKSPDFAGISPFQETSWRAISLVALNQTTGNMTATHSLSNGVSASHTVSLSTGSTFSYVRDNYYLPMASPANFINVQLGNNSSTPFEVLGLGLDYVSSPWKAQNP